MHIFGAYVPQEILQMHNSNEGFLVHGRAISARAEIEKARVLLAPLNFGAGLKGKFTDAMQVGTPTVTTTTGAEGMTSGLNWNGKIEDSSQAFAHAAVEMYTDKDLWKEASDNGFRILKHEFSLPVHEHRFKEILQELTEKLLEHRASNFTGQMLHHHTLNSTKYLSKYIEAKNKNRP